MKPVTLVFVTEDDMHHLHETYGVETASEDIPVVVWARIVKRVETRLKEDDWFWDVLQNALLAEGIV